LLGEVPDVSLHIDAIYKLPILKDATRKNTTHISLFLPLSPSLSSIKRLEA
jgi:hypothetical protein